MNLAAIRSRFLRAQRVQQQLLSQGEGFSLLKINGVKCQIGRGTYGHEDIAVLSWEPLDDTMLHIGQFCSISFGLKIFLGGNHRTDWISTYPFGHTNKLPVKLKPAEGHPRPASKVFIGNDVWIGRDCTIMSGVNIGHGCVVAANSHVTKTFEPYSIIGGNPASLIKYRFSEDIISRLLKLNWWDWPDDTITQNYDLLCQLPTLENLHKLSKVSKSNHK
jgi:acetyltransferase-like isoleucine patch superfamily enzyme